MLLLVAQADRGDGFRVASLGKVDRDGQPENDVVEFRQLGRLKAGESRGQSLEFSPVETVGRDGNGVKEDSL